MRSILPLLTILLLGLHPVSTMAESSPLLESTLKAHGGLKNWRAQGTVEYDLIFNLGERKMEDHQLFDLHNRAGRITSPNYSIGYDPSDKSVWITPDLKSLPIPARFYLWTPFYFGQIPFILADPGCQAEARPDATFEGNTYKVVHVTFAPGTGDAPDDYYTLYLDPKTGEVKLAIYIVTYPGLRRANPDGSVPASAIVYRKWQTVDGLTVPAFAELYHWKDGKPEGEPKGTLTYQNLRFNSNRPDPALFQRPAGAVTDPLPGPSQ